ncbi:Scavenger receptor cysteine-rich type 1 M130, partial [Paramuricea clavata]
MRPKTSREVSTNEDQTKASSETSPRTYNSGNQPRRTINVAVAGDSMLKYINPSKLSKSLKQNVHVKTFPGAKVADMEHYVKPTLAHAPEYLVLHVGTNDLRQKSPRQIATSITKLGHEINANMPNTKLILSEVIVRNDDPQLMIKVKEVNSKLSQ